MGQVSSAMPRINNTEDAIKMEIIGLPLSLALEILDETPIVVDTAPPFVSKTRIPIWGEERVLRATRKEGRLELLVARELLGEDKTLTSP